MTVASMSLVERVARRSSLPGLLCIAGWLLLWHGRAAEGLSASAFVTIVGFVVVCWAYGTAIELAVPTFVENRTGLAFRFALGFLAFNSLLYAFSLATPFGMKGNVAVLSVLPWLAIAGFRFFGPRVRTVGAGPVDQLPGLLCIVVIGAIASLWAREHQPVMHPRGDEVVFYAWDDIFIHVREISAYAQARGWSSMSDIKMLGSHAPAYHFASYMSTAALTALTGTTAFTNFGGFQLPFGVLLMGLAAFVLVGTLWSPWHGVAAALGLAVLPDAYQQGVPTAYLGFAFMSQVNVGMLYGIACISFAWIFMIEGCRRGRYGALIVAYLILALTVFHKAHVFVANAWLLMIFPALFFHGWSRRWRIAVFIAMTAIFVTVIAISQTSNKVPVMRLDGSGLGEYLLTLTRGSDEGLFKRALYWLLFDHEFGRSMTLAVGTVVVFVGSFGVWTVLGPVAFRLTRHLRPAPIGLFVALVVANYAVMSLGLAVDNRGIGTPEELLNRPMAWAYFVVVSFSCAAVYAWLRDQKSLAAPRRRALLGAVVAAGCANVYAHSFNAQTLSPLQSHGDYALFNSVPACLVRSAVWVREHSAPDEVLQDSYNDPAFITTAIAERQMYIGESYFAGKAAGQDERIHEIYVIELKGDPVALEALAKRVGIAWFLLHPEQALRWPRSFLDRAAYTCDGYRVFHFPS